LPHEGEQTGLVLLGDLDDVVALEVLPLEQALEEIQE